MPIVKTSSKGQVVIPAEIREKIGLKPGDKVLVTLADDKRVSIEPVPDDPIKALRGFLKGRPSLTRALLRERRKDRQREEKKSARFLRHHDLGSGRTGRSNRRGSSRRGQPGA
ncbi:MAG: AbrB/MazE/SpoVT family DNA-binding domain-containing protein [Candidatus Binatia bacterium]